jgi:hypothetical protein
MSAEHHAYDGPLAVVYQYDPDCWCRGTGEHDEDVTCGSWMIDGGEPDVGQLAEMLRVGAAGECAWEASVELLIAHEHWLRVARLRTYIDAFLGYVGRSSQLPDLPTARFDWIEIGRALDDRAFPASSSELGVLRVAASLASRHVDVNLHQALGSLDRANAALVATAIAHAGGIRQQWR